MAEWKGEGCPGRVASSPPTAQALVGVKRSIAQTTVAEDKSSLARAGTHSLYNRVSATENGVGKWQKNSTRNEEGVEMGNDSRNDTSNSSRNDAQNTTMQCVSTETSGNSPAAASTGEVTNRASKKMKSSPTRSDGCVFQFFGFPFYI